MRQSTVKNRALSYPVNHPLCDDYYVLRRPLLPLSVFEKLSQASSIEELQSQLYELYKSAKVQEAIYLSSQGVFTELKKWLVAEPKEIPKPLLITLYKYALRMSSRATPFGLMASVELAQITDADSCTNKTSITCAYSRLDMYTADQLVKKLTAIPGIKNQLLFFPNNTIYKLQDEIRFFEYRYIKGVKNHFLVALPLNTALEYILDIAARGITLPLAIHQLFTKGIDNSVAVSILEKLIEQQVLISEFEPNLTGPAYQDYVLERLKTFQSHSTKVDAFFDIIRYSQIEGLIIQRCNKIRKITKEHFPEVPTHNLLQVDLVSNGQSKYLKKDVVNLLGKELAELAVLNQQQPPSDLVTFKNAFTRRYEGREVPLLEALDTDLGIGYGSALLRKHPDHHLLKGIVLAKPVSQENRWEAYQSLLLKKLIESKETGSFSVEITQEDIEKLKEGQPLNGSLVAFFIMGNILAASDKDFDKGNFQFFLRNYAGPSALPLMTRFANALPRLKNKLEKSYHAEEAHANGAIFAEIVHLPESRAGNIIQRPDLAAYEIPFLGKSLKSADQQIPLQDLLISIVDGTVVLRSQKLNKIILPKLTCAHNYREGIPVYRFLADMQYQQPFVPQWNWRYLDDQFFLPRITYKHLIVYRASWTFDAAVSNKFLLINTLADWHIFQQQYHLPDTMVLADGDHELPLNLAQSLARDILKQRIKKGGKIKFYEFIFQNSGISGKHTRKRYADELIIPFIAPSTMAGAAPADQYVPATKTVSIVRDFPFGSSWIYLKIYCSVNRADKLLTNQIPLLLQRLNTELQLTQWFFIRYNDPDHHIRLRIRCEESAKFYMALTIIVEFTHSICRLQLARKIQYDTYERELERYFPETMEFSEAIFWNDSEFVLTALARVKQAKSEVLRWQIAIYGIHQLLDIFSYDLIAKKELMSRYKTGYNTEWGDSGLPDYQLDASYRERRSEVEAIFTQQWAARYELSDAITNREINMGIQAAQIMTALNGNRIKLTQLLFSYCHMFINRIFFSEQRLQEAVVYHHLEKFYKTRLALQKTVHGHDTQSTSQLTI